MPEKSITASLLWDRLGISVSGICAIHCLFFPALISVLPLWSFTPIIHNWAHPVFIALLAPVIFFASKRSHFDFKITTILTAGFLLIVIGWLFGHFWLGFVFETTMTLLGGIILIAGHWLNYRHHRKCSNKNHDHHPVAE